MAASNITSIEDYVRSVRQYRAELGAKLWFKGRRREFGYTASAERLQTTTRRGRTHENKMLQNFRMKAPVFAASPCPDRKATDQWLFLAQHVRLPTRLLDWTQSALVGLHFALLTPAPVVWIINLFELNRRSAPAA